MTEQEKTFAIPGPTTALTDEVTTLIHPLSLAIAKEVDQIEAAGSMRQSSFVEVRGGYDAVIPNSSSKVLEIKHYDLSKPRLIKEVLADENAPQDLKNGIEKMLEGLRNGTVSLS